MKSLWTFENKEKLDKFLAIIQEHGLEYEVSSKGNKSGEQTLSVAEGDYAKAKKLLLKHRKRRTSADLN